MYANMVNRIHLFLLIQIFNVPAHTALLEENAQCTTHNTKIALHQISTPHQWRNDSFQKQGTLGMPPYSLNCVNSMRKSTLSETVHVGDNVGDAIERGPLNKKNKTTWARPI